MIVNPTQITGINAAAPEPNERVPVKMLGQNEFLKLLVTQMRNQDPMAPVSDTEFIAQMAQFSSLEQTKSMSADITKLRQGNDFLQATDLNVKDGEARIIVGDKAYTLDQVTSVSGGDPEAEEQTTTE